LTDILYLYILDKHTGMTNIKKILLYLIIPTRLGDKYKLQRFSLCNLLLWVAISPLLV